MNKTLYIILFAISVSFAGIEKSNEKMLKFSKNEWDVVKKCVDTNGYCRIVNQNAAIVITNGLPEVEHLFPLIENRLERNPLRLEGKRGKKDPYKPGPEPMPYAGQGGLL